MKNGNDRTARQGNDRLTRAGGTVAWLVALGWFSGAACSRKPDGAPDAVRVQPSASSARVHAAESGEAVRVGGQTTGYLRLADGRVVRTAKQTCPSTRPRPDECRATRRACKADAECTAQAHGFCADLGDNRGCGCHYGCLDDAECGERRVCLCGEPVGTCVDTACTSESCVAPARCATYHDGCAYQPFACIEHAGTQTCTF